MLSHSSHDVRGGALRLAASVLLILIGSGVTVAQDPAASPDPTIHTATDAAEADGDPPKDYKFNE